MNKCLLKDVAEVWLSNVDKKTYEGQKQVRLCNFTDVYYNWSISKNYLDNLMVASASDSEIDKFQLFKGDVAITKDSETRGDIGQSVYIADNIDNMVLGYHCALIRPDSSKLLGAYLNAYLHTKNATKYFEYNATGSGQRYTLTLDSIENFQIYLPSIEEQKKVVEIISSIDKKIQNNNRINDNLQQLCQSYFLQHFANKTANGKIGDLIIENPKSTIQVNQSDDVSGQFPFFTSGETINKWTEYMVDGINLFMSTGGNATLSIYDGKAAYSTDTWSIKAKDKYIVYLYFYLLNILDKVNSWHFTGSGLKHLQKDSFSDIKLYIPNESELTEFNLIAKKAISTISHNQLANKSLITLRDLLLPLLMNGQATIE